MRGLLARQLDGALSARLRTVESVVALSVLGRFLALRFDQFLGLTRPGADGPQLKR